MSSLWDRQVLEVNTVPWEMGGLVRLADGGTNVLTSSGSLESDVAALALDDVSHPSLGSTADDGCYFEALHETGVGRGRMSERPRLRPSPVSLCLACPTSRFVTFVLPLFFLFSCPISSTSARESNNFLRGWSWE